VLERLVEVPGVRVEVTRSRPRRRRGGIRVAGEWREGSAPGQPPSVNVGRVSTELSSFSAELGSTPAPEFSRGVLDFPPCLGLVLWGQLTMEGRPRQVPGEDGIATQTPRRCEPCKSLAWSPLYIETVGLGHRVGADVGVGVDDVKQWCRS
jgi:hypothetical protein